MAWSAGDAYSEDSGEPVDQHERHRQLGQSLQQSLTQLITSLLTIVGVLILMLTISPLLAVISLLGVMVERALPARKPCHDTITAGGTRWAPETSRG